MSVLIQGIPNGPAKSGVSVQKWDGTEVDRGWGIVLPSGQKQSIAKNLSPQVGRATI